MNWQSRGGAVQSEIGLMLPTTAPGPCSQDREKTYKRGPVTFSSRSKQLVFTETDEVCEPPEKYVLIRYVVHRGDLEVQSA